MAVEAAVGQPDAAHQLGDADPVEAALAERRAAAAMIRSRFSAV